MLLEGQYQIAYVTRDVDRAVQSFRAMYGIEKWIEFEGGMDVVTAEGRGVATVKAALGWAGATQYELIQPLSGMVSIYADALRDDVGLRHHHISMRVNDLAAVRREVVRQNINVVLDGEASATFFYADTRATFGHYLEYVQMTDEIWKMVGGP
jgi:hypothetical protein